MSYPHSANFLSVWTNITLIVSACKKQCQLCQRNCLKAVAKLSYMSQAVTRQLGQSQNWSRKSQMWAAVTYLWLSHTRLKPLQDLSYLCHNTPANDSFWDCLKLVTCMFRTVISLSQIPNCKNRFVTVTSMSYTLVGHKTPSLATLWLQNIAFLNASRHVWIQL